MRIQKRAWKTYNFLNSFNRYHNKKRLLPDYMAGYSTNLTTKVQAKYSVPPSLEGDEGDDSSSIVLDMKDHQRSQKNTSNAIKTAKLVQSEDATSTYYEASLTLDNVKPKQSGNYTCGPSNSLSASVRLHITQGSFAYSDVCYILGGKHLNLIEIWI